MKKNSIRRILFAALLLFGVGAVYLYTYYNNTNDEEIKAKKHAVEQEISLLSQTLVRAVQEKQKALNAIALALLFDSNIERRVKDKNVPSNYFSSLNRDFRKYSNYKNIWMQLYDENGSVLYKSWIKNGNDSIPSTKNPRHYFQQKELLNYIDIDPYDLCINSLLKLQDDKGNYLGALELKAHFNSISNEMKRYGATSVVVVEKSFRPILVAPFTNIFVDGYYIANLDADKKNLEFLRKTGVERFMRPGYLLYGDTVILSFPLKNQKGETVAYYILFKDIRSSIVKLRDKAHNDWITIAFLTLLLVVFAILAYESYLSSVQKRYYKSIIDNSRNIIIVTDGKRIVDVNKSFLEFFQVASLEEFMKRNKSCLLDYFVKEEGYLNPEKTGDAWFEYVLKNPQKKHKVKLEVNGSTYYFLVTVSKIESDEELYSIVMADITAEEKYRLELEKTAITDPLTGIYNRRYFQKKLKEEISLAQRYSRPFSLILMDIDHFKKINDRYGHDVGDKVLVEFATAVKKQLRNFDVFCRIGGEEFAVILPETKLHDAVRVAKKINRIVRENPNTTIKVTVSMGVVEYIKGESEADIYKRADNALYKAKTSGRDRVMTG